MNCLTIHLHLQSPLLISQLGGGDPNSSVGFHYIPGSTLRGAIISRYLAGQAGDATDVDFQRLFLNGSVRFLNGYPLATNGRRTLPLPLSWQRPKDDKTAVAHDWAICKPETGQQAESSTDQGSTSGQPFMQKGDTDRAWKGIGERKFCYLEGSKAELLAPTMQINIHIAREDRQRPTADGAAIFRYDALAAGQRFAAMIIAENADDLQTIKSLLPDGLRLPLGGSRTAGYGWVVVHCPKGTEDEPFTEPQTEWDTPLENIATVAPPTKLIVTLLSDTLVQDPESGAYSADLKPVLGVDAEERFVRLHKVGGFNRKWNLPLPQAEAISAGSVFVYPYSDSLQKTLRQLVEKGIGNRRAEGFGRIAVNWHQSAEIELTEQRDANDENTDACEKIQAARRNRPKIHQSQALTQQVVKRLLRAQLDRLLLQAINIHTIHRRGMRNAQLSRIRVVARHVLEPHHHAKAATDKSIHGLVNFLDKLKKSARDQLDRARIHTIISAQQEMKQNGDVQTREEVYAAWLEELAKKRSFLI